ncbi:MAG: hypothetical protein AAF570_07295 [Bacteroidota bacterium]
MKSRLFSIFACLFLSLTLILPGCKDNQAAQNSTTTTTDTPATDPAEALVKEYQNGEVLRCTFEGKTYFQCARNAYDAGSEIFDHDGKKLGGCYYSTGQVNPLCEVEKDCEVVYRVKDNIWGKPAVPSDD